MGVRNHGDGVSRTPCRTADMTAGAQGQASCPWGSAVARHSTDWKRLPDLVWFPQTKSTRPIFMRWSTGRSCTVIPSSTGPRASRNSRADRATFDSAWGRGERRRAARSGLQRCSFESTGPRFLGPAAQGLPPSALSTSIGGVPLAKRTPRGRRTDLRFCSPPS